ncbi:MAG: TolC family protein [Acidobacteriota bacterium]
MSKPTGWRVGKNHYSRRHINLYALSLFVLLSAVVFLSEGATDAYEGEQKTKPANTNLTTLARGLNHFEAHCAVCHANSGKADNEKGKALSAADLTAKEIQAKSDAQLTKIIQNGIPGTAMPAFGKTHSPMEIKQLIAFIRKLPTLTDAEREKIRAATPPDARHQHTTHTEHQGDQHKDKQTNEHQHNMQSQKTADEQPLYICPMHADVQSNMPGSCPKCGMKLVKKTSASSEHQDLKMQNPDGQPATQKNESHADHKMNEMRVQQNAPDTPSMTLAELEQQALKNNPTLAQSELAVRAAEGRRLQAGLLPNPIIGYSGEEFAFRAFSNKSEHFFFVEQEIPLGGKLKKSRAVAEQEKLQTAVLAEAQRVRVLNTVQMLFYQTLGAQQLVEAKAELAKIIHEAVSISEELLNLGQADQPDQLDVEIESQKTEIELLNAENNLAKSWQLLATAVGNPALAQTRLAGDLEKSIPTFDKETVAQTLLQQSPEMKVASVNLERARAALTRAKAERVPDMVLRGGFGYSTEKLELGNAPFPKKTGPEARIEIGFRLPIFNRNQGGIAAAEAELASAEREIARVELAIRARLAQVWTNYQNAERAVARYRDAILPRAKKSYELYTASFAQMAAAYPQVLIAKRSYYQARTEYLNALVALWQNGISIQGYLLTGGLDGSATRMNESEATQGGERHE